MIVQRIFSIPTDQLLLPFLHYSRPLREFCGFSKVPDASKITRFKQDFLDDLQTVFDNLVDITEPICQAIDPVKADMTIFDSSGIEAFVTENNPKYANRITKQLKAYAKSMGFDKSYDPYKAAYGSMPSHASANPEIKQLYINGHFCYVFKFGVVTNGLGIIRHISFYNRDFLNFHSDIIVDKKSDSPDEDKCAHDPSLPMKPEGSRSNLRSGIPTFKFVCPKMQWVYDKTTRKAHRECHCDNPCTSSKCGRMVYIYPEKDLRAYLGVIRGTEE